MKPSFRTSAMSRTQFERKTVGEYKMPFLKSRRRAKDGMPGL